MARGRRPTGNGSRHIPRSRACCPPSLRTARHKPESTCPPAGPRTRARVPGVCCTGTCAPRYHGGERGAEVGGRPRRVGPHDRRRCRRSGRPGRTCGRNVHSTPVGSREGCLTGPRRAAEGPRAGTREPFGDDWAVHPGSERPPVRACRSQLRGGARPQRKRWVGTVWSGPSFPRSTAATRGTRRTSPDRPFRRTRPTRTGDTKASRAGPGAVPS